MMSFGSKHIFSRGSLRVSALIVAAFFALFSVGAFNPRVQFFRSQLEDSTLTRSTKIEYFDSLLATNPSDRARLLFHKASALRLSGNIDKALQTYRDAYACGVMLDESDRMEALYAISALLNESGKSVDALGEATRLLSLPKSDSLKYFDVKGWMTVYNILLGYDDVKGALKAATTGLNKLEQVKNVTDKSVYKDLSGALLIMRGGADTFLGNYQKAYEDYTQAGKVLNEKYLGMLNLNLGVLFSEMKQHDIARSYYIKAMEDKWLDSRNKSAAVVNYFVNLVDMGRFDEALEEVGKYKEELEAIYGTPDEYKLWSIISEAYEGKREWRMALEYRNKAVELKDSLLSGEMRSRIDDSLAEIETISARNQNPESQASGTGSGVLIGVLGAFALIGVVGGGILLWRYRRARKTAAAAAGRLEESEKEVALLSGSREEAQQLSRELTVCKARLSHITEALGELKRIAGNPRTHKSEIVGAVERATRSISSDANVWEPFMAYAEGAGQPFFDKLYRLHPDLTNSEIRMCAFILLSRTTKEIAAILNRSPRTVESIKYSLRLKLRVKDMTTEQYLRKISSTPIEELES